MNQKSNSHSQRAPLAISNYGSRYLQELTADLAQVDQRLKFVCIIYAVFWMLALLISYSFWLSGVTRYTFAVLGNTLIAIPAIAISLGLYGLVASQKYKPEILLDIGLGYQVLAAFFIAMSDSMVYYSANISFYGISWVCVWVVFYPLVVPCSSGKGTIVVFISSSMGVMAVLIIAVVRQQMPPSALITNVLLNNYLAGAISAISLAVVCRCNEHIVNKQIGSYRLIEPLGRGGMGEVWRAAHKLLRRPAAVKLIRPEALGTQNPKEAKVLLKRFEREAQATAALHSAHSIQLYDFGITDDGCFFYVMELLNGINFQELVARFGPVPPERVVHFLQQMCDSLLDAHLSGLIHRDIKPANVFVCKYGHQYDFVKILDFGMVKFAQGAGDEKHRLTITGTITATPAFMAPEMAAQGKIDARIDIYALGCVAYWLLTAKLVFPAKKSIEMVIKHLNSAPIPPSQRSDIVIPEPLEKLVMACLEKDPNNRPQKISEVSRQLAAMQIERWTRTRTQKWWQEYLKRP